MRHYCLTSAKVKSGQVTLQDFKVKDDDNGRSRVTLEVKVSLQEVIEADTGPGTGRPPGWGRRHVMGLLGFWGFAVVYAMRVGLSVAIVSMVARRDAFGGNLSFPSFSNSGYFNSSSNDNHPSSFITSINLSSNSSPYDLFSNNDKYSINSSTKDNILNSSLNDNNNNYLNLSLINESIDIFNLSLNNDSNSALDLYSNPNFPSIPTIAPDSDIPITSSNPVVYSVQSISTEDTTYLSIILLLQPNSTTQPKISTAKHENQPNISQSTTVPSISLSNSSTTSFQPTSSLTSPPSTISTPPTTRQHLPSTSPLPPPQSAPPPPQSVPPPPQYAPPPPQSVHPPPQSAPPPPQSTPPPPQSVHPPPQSAPPPPQFVPPPPQSAPPPPQFSPSISLSPTPSPLDVCPTPRITQKKQHSEIPGGEFEWDESIQGHVIGSSFYGYLLTVAVGGRAAELLGARLVFGLGVLTTGFLTLLTPLCARASLGALLGLRLAQGLAEGVTYPAMHTLISQWAPPLERPSFAANIYAGAQFGTVLSLALTGWLTGTLGWPSVFYAFGAMGVAWGVVWFLMVGETPSKQRGMTREEREYIMMYCGGGEVIPLPWIDLLTSLPLWTVFLGHLGWNWGFYLLLNHLPTYLDNILHLDVNENGVNAALPYLAMWGFSVLYSSLVATLLRGGRLSLVAVRRISTLVGSHGPMVGILALSYAGCSAPVALVVLCVSVGLSGAAYCGFFTSHHDLAPGLSGSLMGLSTALGTVPGFVVPVLVGYFTNGNQTLSAWRAVFMTTAALMFVCCSFYLVFVTTQEQPWSSGGGGDKDKSREKQNKNTTR